MAWQLGHSWCSNLRPPSRTAATPSSGTAEGWNLELLVTAGEGPLVAAVLRDGRGLERPGSLAVTSTQGVAVVLRDGRGLEQGATATG
ncbi:hypothetical protein GCM10022245_05050 [Streptomyces mayteni]